MAPCETVRDPLLVKKLRPSVRISANGNREKGVCQRDTSCNSLLIRFGVVLTRCLDKAREDTL